MSITAPLVQYRLEGFDAFSEKEEDQHCREREFALFGKTFLISSMSAQECIGTGDGFKVCSIFYGLLRTTLCLF